MVSMNRMTRQGEWRWLQLWWKGAASVNRPQDASKNTITKLLGELGNARSRYQVQTLPNLPCKRLPCDEIWAFVYAKKKNVTPEILERNPEDLTRGRGPLLMRILSSVCRGSWVRATPIRRRNSCATLNLVLQAAFS